MDWADSEFLCSWCSSPGAFLERLRPTIIMGTVMASAVIEDAEQPGADVGPSLKKFGLLDERGEGSLGHLFGALGTACRRTEVGAPSSRPG